MLLLMDVNQLDLQLIQQPAPVLEIFFTQYVKPNTSNLRKMRTSKIHFLGFQNSKNYKKKHQILNFYDDLQSCQPTSAS